MHFLYCPNIGIKFYYSLIILYVHGISDNISSFFPDFIYVRLLFFSMSLAKGFSALLLQRSSFYFHWSFYCLLVSVFFISVLILVISFLLAALSFIYSSLSSSLRCKVRLFFRFFLFLEVCSKNDYFPLKTASAVFHTFWYTLFPVSFIWKF